MRKELTLADRIKVALMQNREEMREVRHRREFATVYSGNLCPVCHRRHMVGIICRKHRGLVCERHCMICEHFEQGYWHCRFQETEPMDMRKWVLVYACNDKARLWRGIYMRELIRTDAILAREPIPRSNEAGAAARARATAKIESRATPKYVIADKPDEYGDYKIADADTGEILPFAVKYLESIPIWACVRYLEPGQ